MKKRVFRQKKKIHDRNRDFRRLPVSDGGVRQCHVRNLRVRSKPIVLQRSKLFWNRQKWWKNEFFSKKFQIHDRNPAFRRFPVFDGGARQTHVRNFILRSKLRVLQRCKLFWKRQKWWKNEFFGKKKKFMIAIGISDGYLYPTVESVNAMCVTWGSDQNP